LSDVTLRSGREHAIARLLLACLLGFTSLRCGGPGPTPTELPREGVGTTASAPAAAVCEHVSVPVRDPVKGESPPAARLVGWLDGRIVVAFADASCTYDPTRRVWFGLSGDPGGPGPDLRARWADGMSWVGIEDDRSLDVMSDGLLRHVPMDPTSDWVVEWGVLGGELLRPLPYGGYVVPLVGAVVRLTSDGTLPQTELPSGFLTVSVAADGSVLARKKPDSLSPSILNGPYELYRWRPGLEAPVRVAEGVLTLDDAEGGLAWLGLADGEVRLLQADGQLGTAVATFDPSRESITVSPSGRVDARRPLDGSFVVLEDRPVGNPRTVDTACGPIAWDGGAAACLASPEDPFHDPWVLVMTGNGPVPDSVAFR
jgi:hypothetical protein